MKALDVCLYEMNLFYYWFQAEKNFAGSFFAACIAVQSGFLYSNGPGL